MELTWRIRKSRNQIQRDNFAAKHKEKQLLCGKFPSFFSRQRDRLEENLAKTSFNTFQLPGTPPHQGRKGRWVSEMNAMQLIVNASAGLVASASASTSTSRFGFDCCSRNLIEKLSAKDRAKYYVICAVYLYCNYRQYTCFFLYMYCLQPLTACQLGSCIINKNCNTVGLIAMALQLGKDGGAV